MNKQKLVWHSARIFRIAMIAVMLMYISGNSLFSWEVIAGSVVVGAFSVWASYPAFIVGYRRGVHETKSQFGSFKRVIQGLEDIKGKIADQLIEEQREEIQQLKQRVRELNGETERGL